MARQVDFAGKSGALYRYTLLEEGHPLWPSGGNYLYVRSTDKGAPKVIYAGEAESLFRGYLEAWDKARADFGATDIYLRLNISGSVRRDEQADIVEQHAPVMNLPQADTDRPSPKPRRTRTSTKG